VERERLHRALPTTVPEVATGGRVAGEERLQTLARVDRALAAPEAEPADVRRPLVLADDREEPEVAVVLRIDHEDQPVVGRGHAPHVLADGDRGRRHRPRAGLLA